MGPIERELRTQAESCRCGTGTGGTPYEFLAGIGGWSLGSSAQELLGACVSHPEDGEWTNEESWSEAIEAAEALGL